MSTDPKTMMTHERYISAVREIAVSYSKMVRDNPRMQLSGIPALSDEQIENVEHAKLVYGRGHITLRGVTQFGAWNNGRSKEPTAKTDELVEVCALGEESWEQLAGTTIHELAHVASGIGVGHAKGWRQNCVALGLRGAKAAGTRYLRSMFAPWVRERIAALPLPEDGVPKSQLDALAGLLKLRPCGAGIGVRGGRARGPGSGRLRKYVCPHGQIVRASTDHLDATCGVCGGKFEMPAVLVLAADGG